MSFISEALFPVPLSLSLSLPIPVSVPSLLLPLISLPSFFSSPRNRRSQGPRTKGTLGEYIPSRRRRGDRVSGRQNDRNTPRDKQPNRRRSQQHATERDEGRYNKDYPPRGNVAHHSKDKGPSRQKTAEHSKGSAAHRSRDREMSNQRTPEEARRSSSHRNRDKRSTGHRDVEDIRADDSRLNGFKEPPRQRAAEDARKSPRPSRSNDRDLTHTSPSEQRDSAPRRTGIDLKDSSTELGSFSNSTTPKSLFQQHGDSTRSFTNSRVFSLDQRSQRVTVKELESQSAGSSQPLSRVRRPLGRGRGIIRRGGDPVPNLPGNKVGATPSDNTPASPSHPSEVKEIAPYDQRAYDEGNTWVTTKACVSHPCKTQVSSDRALQEELLSPAQEEAGSPKKGKEKESILGEPPPSVATGKPKRYSSQRQKVPASAHEELVDEPGKCFKGQRNQ